MEEVLAELRRRYDRHDWVRVTEGYSGAGVWRLDGNPGCYVKIAGHSAHPDGGFHPLAEVERLAWLREQGFPAPEVREAGERDGSSWLVTTAVPGRSAAAEWPAEHRGEVVDALADLARELHSVPVEECPFDRRLEVTVPHARQAAEAGLVDLEDLDEERAGWPAARLVEELDRTRPDREELVVCHGDLCLPNVLLDPDTRKVTGVIDVGRLGVADRYADLALATRSLASDDLNPRYGPELADRFLARYGERDVDVERIAFYRLLDEFF
ncbi:APH(3') family aminoglycoside O-phosphotransferase [Amycolatopsis anabasis]|uniref:APH(3') family aminoglycoside O-phosphotransferase n=1 Tax=Amycolatopsis anabasis TaxID=1840409 RepID=UPI00131ECB1D|nr:APH(3') family aminoglycoside O-phosphotransferase [Amycolatopsis anabasis]